MPAGVAYLAMRQLSQTLDISVDLSADGRLRTVCAKSARALCWRARLAALRVVLPGGVPASTARADGDPGSDVLVYQNLFAGSEGSVGSPAGPAGGVEGSRTPGVRLASRSSMARRTWVLSQRCGASRGRMPASWVRSCRWLTAAAIRFAGNFGSGHQQAMRCRDERLQPSRGFPAHRVAR
jgi:hypothetical protein